MVLMAHALREQGLSVSHRPDYFTANLTKSQALFSIFPYLFPLKFRQTGEYVRKHPPKTAKCFSYAHTPDSLVKLQFDGQICPPLWGGCPRRGRERCGTQNRLIDDFRRIRTAVFTSSTASGPPSPKGKARVLPHQCNYSSNCNWPSPGHEKGRPCGRPLAGICGNRTHLGGS